MRTMALVMLLALSGCLGGPGEDDRREPTPDPPDGPPEEPSRPAPTRIWLLRGFGFDGCQGIEVQARVDADAAQALLPDNHTAATGDGGAVARWRILACRTFTSGPTTIEDTLYGDVGLALESATPATHWYRFAIFSHDDNLAAAWEVAGYHVVGGNASLRADEVGPAADVNAAFSGYSARFVAAAAASGGGDAVLMTETPLGLVVWNETVEASGTAGIGTWSVPHADPFAPLLADGRAVALEWKWLSVTITGAQAYREGVTIA